MQGALGSIDTAGKGGGEMKKSYDGTITNAGAQVVQPVHSRTAEAPNRVVRGTDLRGGLEQKK